MSRATPQTSALAGRRVAFVLGTLDVGGAERQAMLAARHLRDRGAVVSVLGLSRPGAVLHACRDDSISCDLVRFRWPCRKSSLLRGVARLALALRRRRPELVMAYTTWANVGAGLAWRLAGSRGCVWHQRDVYALTGHRVERWAYRRCTAAVVNGAHQLAYLERSLGPRRPAPTVFPNGVTLPPARADRATWRRRLGIPDAARVACMVANFRPEKDFVSLLRAWQRLGAGAAPARVLVLAGAGEDEGRVRDLATALGIADSLRFAGQVEDITGLLQAADVSVLSTHGEGMPNAVLEAMAAGLPVVGTDVAALREALPACSHALLAPPETVDALAASLDRALTDPQLARRLGDANRTEAQRRYSVAEYCASTERLVCAQLQQRPAHA
ncbi:MAG: glycosyltransferase family 4 protein [Planctomycetota bacterium]